MKQLLLSALLVASAFVAKAQPPSITNTTSCTIKVTQICYNPTSCAAGVNWSVSVPPGFTVPMPAQCPFPRQTSYKVCWDTPVCVPAPCTMVDGTTPIGNCSGAPYTDILQTCDVCSPDGTATVTFNPATRSITVTP